MSTEVKPGYKLTDVGVIPEDWAVNVLSEICERISVGLATSVTKFYRNSGTPIVRNLNIKDGFFDCGDMLYLDEKFSQENISKAAKGLDVITVHTGSNLGQTCVLPASFHNCQTFTTLITTPKKNILDPFYLSIHMGSHFGRSEMARLQVGGGKGNLNTGDLKKYRIVVAPLIEQKSIAAALSDMDTMISSLDQLIAKKCDIQQATMQQLLTGQRRLPGFSGEWEVKRLGDVGDLISGGTPKTSNPEYWGGNIKWCTPTDITRSKGKYLSETERSISEAGLVDSGAKLLPAGSLLICTRATIGELKIATAPICTNQGFKSLVCYDGISHEFMYYKLLTMKKDMVERAFGSTFLEISKANISAITLSVPPLAEQTAIATILSDMDTELAALEDRRDKNHQLKQGMMQELLTGRVRLA